MSIKAFPTKSGHRAHDVPSETAGQTMKIDSTTPIKLSRTDRFASRLVKILHVHRPQQQVTDDVNTPASPIPKPKQIYRFRSPAVKNPPEVELTPSSSLTSPPTRADSPCPVSAYPTPPTTPGSEVRVDSTHPIPPTTEYDTALAGLHEAEKILQQRHAAIKPLARRDTLTTDTPLEALIKKKKTPSPKGTATLPRHLPPPAHRQQKKQVNTAKEACDALQRRQLVRNLAYRAINGCDDAIAAVDKLNDHYASKEEQPDLTLNFEGIHVHARQLGSVEHTWIARANAMRKLEGMTVRKQLGTEDYEQIFAQLFPNDAHDLLDDQYFEIFVTGLGTEGILTVREAKHIASLGISREEFEQGATWRGPSPSSSPSSRYDAANIAIFDIPTNTSHSFPPTKHSKDLYPYLRTLAEAAVYELKFYKGYFFPNVRSKLLSFHAAQFPSTSPTPLNLLEYRRTWTRRETRLLQRAKLIVELLESFESGVLTDFGIIRSVRGTFVRIPGQGSWDVENLTTYLYHRVADSGLPIALIPSILALHPEHDQAFANQQRRKEVEKELREQAEGFEMEEQQRLRDIEKSASTFESLRKKEMGVWGRIKYACRKLRGKNEVVAPFDPFAGEVGEGVEESV